MAAAVNTLAEHLKSASLDGEFQVRPFYEPDTDSLVYYIRDVSSYSKRANQYFTLFLANDDDSLVGFEVKGLKTLFRAIEDLGDVELIKPVTVKDEDGDCFDLSVVIRCALVPKQDEPVSGSEYDQLAEATKGVRVSKESLC